MPLLRRSAKEKNMALQIVVFDWMAGNLVLPSRAAFWRELTNLDKRALL